MDSLLQNNPITESSASAVVICCSALMRDLSVIFKANDWRHIEIDCITAELHNYPDKITAAVKTRIDIAKHKKQQIFVAYADCGTGGRLDALLQKEQVQRLDGAHCYEFFAGKNQFELFSEAELGTFYLTDFLVRHFDRLVIRGLGLDRKPELQPLYFGHYRKLVYLSQSADEGLKVAAQQAAKRLSLEYQYYHTGRSGLEVPLINFNQKIAVQLLQ
jgi:hypothetical protein